MLKGKSKIELFDAATGAKVLEQSDANMVTNALDILANVKEETGLLRRMRKNAATGTTDLTPRLGISPCEAMMPLNMNALGGILLWDENITEDPSIVLPPPGITEVGHAGGAYGGADLYRGGYNENESGEIEGGWRHVWDFDTDKANGTIRCMSLTSRHGGNIGYHCCYEDDLYPLYNYFCFNPGSSYEAINVNNVYVKVKGDDVTGTVFYVRSMEDNGLRLYKKNKNKVWYIDVPDLSRIPLCSTGPECIGDSVELPFTLTGYVPSLYVYRGQIHELALLTTSRLQHRIFTLEGEQVSSKTFDLPFTYLSMSENAPAVYRDGYYYCVTRQDCDIIKLDGQGQEVSRFAFLKDSRDTVENAAINEHSGEIVFSVHCYGNNISNGYNPFVVTMNDEVSHRSNGSSNFPIGSHSNPPSGGPYPQFVKTDHPDSLFVFYSDSEGRLAPLINSAYLATINNLQVPITKTAAQTMKITYEIYDE